MITKSKSTMAVVTLEDLQGTLEVVVFPKTYEQTMGTWRDGAILLVAGRVDHRGDEASLLADSVWDWDTVADRGPEAFATEVGLARQARPRRDGGRGTARRRERQARRRQRRTAAGRPAPAAAAVGPLPGPGRAGPRPTRSRSGGVASLRR